MADLKLYADSSWQSPYVFHVMVALAEMRLKYDLLPQAMPIPDEAREVLRERAVIGLVPALADGEFWLTESSAISEYLDEKYAPPAPHLYPREPRERARARQVLSYLRSSLRALREDRPTTSVFRRPVATPLSERGRADAAELVRIAEQLLPTSRDTLFVEWSIADLDLALALMRLVANGDPVPPRLHAYALAQWGRESVRMFYGHIPTTPLP